MQENKENNPTPLMVQYLSIKDTCRDCLLFYRLGDFYELFFDDAVTASRELDIVLTSRGRYAGKDIPMCGVPFHSYESYLSRLIKKGYKVAICEQSEDPKEAKKRGASAIVKRDIIRIVTPGTLTEDNILNSRAHNYLMVIYGSRKGYGIAYSDISTLSVNLTFKPDNETMFDFVHKIMPSEIVVPDDFDDGLLYDFRKSITKLPHFRFDYKKMISAAGNNLEAGNLDIYGNFVREEEIAVGALLDYIETTQKGITCKFNRVNKINDRRFMEIPAATRASLEIFVSNSDNKNMTLRGVIDETVTSGGARLLNEILSEPLLQKDKINARLDGVEFFVNNDIFLEQLRQLLKECYDLERAVSRLSFGRGGPRDLLIILKTVDVVPRLKELFKNDDCMASLELPAVIKEMLTSFADLADIKNKLTVALKTDVPLLARDGGFIKKGYDAAFDNECLKRDDGIRFIAELQKKYQDQTGIPNLKIVHNNILGYFIEVTAKVADKLFEDKEHFIHRQTLANNVRFTTVELSGLEDELKKSAEIALAMELAIYDDLVKTVVSKSSELLNTAKTVSFFDVLASFAVIARRYDYIRPEITDDNSFIVEKGRHPIVERYMSDFMSNDCIMDENNRVWLITGPNMAGKSTFLRQNALIAIMAQIGSFVPASKAKIGIVDKVFSRVGASDDLAHGRSTFMVEMTETAVILNQATAKSLVILDEIGRGTSTFDGLSIAWATLEHLHNKNKCRALFATHYHELTVLAETLMNLCLYTIKVKEWDGNIVFLHEIIKGVADRSYGIHVAKLAGMPGSVIARAGEILKQLENNDNKTTSLPLFAVEQTKPDAAAVEFMSKYQNIVEQLLSVDPDSLSPKDALDVLYRFRASL